MHEKRTMSTFMSNCHIHHPLYYIIIQLILFPNIGSRQINPYKYPHSFAKKKNHFHQYQTLKSIMYLF